MSVLGHETRRLFQCLRRRWLPEPDLQEGFLKSLDGFSSLQEHLRQDRGLDRLSRQMYVDLADLISDADSGTGNGGAGESGSVTADGRLTVAEVHEILHIIQTMEIAWLNARMDHFDAHPLNRGWVAAFHRWSMMPAFRRLWPVLRTDFSRPFIEYCESRFSLGVGYTRLMRLPQLSAVSAAQDDCRTCRDELDQLEVQVAKMSQNLSHPQSRNAQQSVAKRVSVRDLKKKELERLEGVCRKLRYAREAIRQEFESEWPEVGRSFFEDRHCRVWYVGPSIRIFDVNETRSNDGSVPVAEHGHSAIPLGFVALLRPAPPRLRSTAEYECRSCDSEAPELRVWVRPQYRFLGVGRHLLDQFAVEALRRGLPRRFRRTVSQSAAAQHPWQDNGPLVTRYLVRTGQEGGHGLRRRMQLGFLYEYSFARQDDRPYDEPAPIGSDGEMHPSLRGVDSAKAISPQMTVVPTILRTTWHAFFEAARSMSSCPQQFNEFIKD